MQIRKKTDVQYFLKCFPYIADNNLDKYYFTFPWEHNGTVTIMKYFNGTYTVHRKNDILWDLHEVPMNEKEIESFIWNHRRFINPVLRGIGNASSIK